jgi:hypothetical protein
MSGGLRPWVDRSKRLLCPAVVRVGVSGHRLLPDDREAELVAAVDGILAELGDPGTVVSSIAEGADRLVAWRGLRRPGWELLVVLPMAPDDYAVDFATAVSRDEFTRLLDAATEIDQVPAQPDRVTAYLAAGMRVLERSDVLIAVWDGAPARGRGGTAEIVERARAGGRPVAWIHAGNDGPARTNVTKERWPWPS